MVELGLAADFTATLALSLMALGATQLPTLFPPPTLPPFHMFFPPFPLPLPDAVVDGWRLAPNPDTNCWPLMLLLLPLLPPLTAVAEPG